MRRGSRIDTRQEPVPGERDFSKIEAGKLTLERVAFLLHHEVDDVLRLLAHAAGKKGLELICDLRSDLPAVLMGDAGRLRQIVVNLVGNAIKFTGNGEVTVRVRQAGRPGSAVRLRFEVADTGMGIPEAEQKRLFQAFVQVDGSSTRKTRGDRPGAGHLQAARSTDVRVDRSSIHSRKRFDVLV